VHYGMKLTETKEGTVIEIYVKPNSPKFQVAVECDEIVVQSTEEPEKGKVNKELIKEFAKLFGTKVELASGATSRKKRFLVVGAGKIDIEKVLAKKSV
jgi:uncharacterized protein